MNFKNTIGIKAALGLFLAASPLLISAQKAGINFSHIDSSANPCNDFYTFCNGNWQKKFQLPASDARYGSFNEINENNLSKIRDIYNAAAANKSATLNSDAQRLRDFYNTAMDSSKADLLGAKPVAAQMAMIDKVNNLGDFIKLKAEFETIGVNLLFGSGVSADLKNSKKNTFGIGQAGFGLGDRDYYHSAQFADIRTQYQKYLSKLFVLSGTPAAQADQMAAQVLNVETRITDKAFTRVQMRDVEKLYNVFNPSDLKTLTPALANLQETLPIFLALAVLSVALGEQGWLSLAGAGLYLAGRVVHVFCYMKGLSPWRSISFLVALLGCLLIAIPLVPHIWR